MKKNAMKLIVAVVTDRTDLDGDTHASVRRSTQLLSTITIEFVALTRRRCSNRLMIIDSGGLSCAQAGMRNEVSEE